MACNLGQSEGIHTWSKPSQEGMAEHVRLEASDFRQSGIVLAGCFKGGKRGCVLLLIGAFL